MHATTEVVAHRGASAYAPEHSLQAYDLALEQGATVLELDVRRDRAGRLVVLHDPTLQRTLGDPRAVRDVSVADLPPQSRPLLLDEVLDRYRSTADWLVELKDPDPQLADGALDCLERHGVAPRATVQSFDHRTLAAMRLRAPHVRVAPLVREGATAAQVAGQVRRARRYAVAVGLHHRSVDAGAIAAARAAGLGVRAWTVNRPAEMERLVALGVDGLITDVPDVARALADAWTAVPAAA